MQLKVRGNTGGGGGIDIGNDLSGQAIAYFDLSSQVSGGNVAGLTLARYTINWSGLTPPTPVPSTHSDRLICTYPSLIYQICIKNSGQPVQNGYYCFDSSGNYLEETTLFYHMITYDFSSTMLRQLAIPGLNLFGYMVPAGGSIWCAHSGNDLSVFLLEQRG